MTQAKFVIVCGIILLLGSSIHAGSFNLSLKRLRGEVDKALKETVQPVKTILEQLEQAGKNDIKNSNVLNIVQQDGVSLVKGIKNVAQEAELEKRLAQIKHDCFWCKQDDLTLTLQDSGPQGQEVFVQTISDVYSYSSLPFILFMHDALKEQEKIIQAQECLKNARDAGMSVQSLDQGVLDIYQEILEFLMRFVNDMVCGQQYKGSHVTNINRDNQSTGEQVAGCDA